MVKVIVSNEDFKEVLKEAGERLVAVEFSASWCGPCRIIKPFFHSLDCEVVCLPTFQFYKKEEKVGEFSGLNNCCNPFGIQSNKGIDSL
uniref:Thioredoxin domain-containing protein n=1 Tax=Castor canadensis TaxID=51338 RepID=A0A8C0VUI3_CASCN